MTKPIEIVFNFDTTGSMYPVLTEVRRRLEEVIGTLFKEVPNLKIGIGANGDYCDERSSYVTKRNDLSNDIYSIVDFVRNVGRTGGGDWPECYELVLHEAKNYSWSDDAQKILVMIGDAIPHEPTYHQNTKRIDWRDATQDLARKGVQVYSVQCLPHHMATSFWKKMPEISGGLHLELDQFTDIVNLITAIVYQQHSTAAVEALEEKIVKTGKMNRTLAASFDTILGRPRDAKGRFVAYKNVTDSGEHLIPVEPGRFQVLDVKTDSVIRDFVDSNDLVFAPGKGFYEFTKRETIQDKKEIVIRDKVTGDMFSGDKARKLLGIHLGMGKSKIAPKHGDKYDVFVQSTSYNRKLIGGTRFLYEVTMEV